MFVLLFCCYYCAKQNRLELRVDCKNENRHTSKTEVLYLSSNPGHSLLQVNKAKLKRMKLVIFRSHSLVAQDKLRTGTFNIKHKAKITGNIPRRFVKLLLTLSKVMNFEKLFDTNCTKTIRNLCDRKLLDVEKCY